MNLSVLIATYGDPKWEQLAIDRAYPSAADADEVILVHQPDGTVGTSRNEAAAKTNGDWLCFLDADDELAPGFVAAMRDAVDMTPLPDYMLFTPKVSYILNGRTRPARFWPEVSLTRGNWLIIGTLIHRNLFDAIGGFRDYGDPPGSNAYEDWSTWSRCVQAGAHIVKVPNAVYVAHVDFASRHRSASATDKRAWHQEIGEDVWPEHYGPAASEPLVIRHTR